MRSSPVNPKELEPGSSWDLRSTRYKVGIEVDGGMLRDCRLSLCHHHVRRTGRGRTQGENARITTREELNPQQMPPEARPPLCLSLTHFSMQPALQTGKMEGTMFLLNVVLKTVKMLI
jgi:hypothetical protein